MLILASASPRRRELLKKLVSSFVVIPPDIDERALDPVMGSADLSHEVARIKAYSVFATHPDDEVLSCDTVVVGEGEVLEKPRDMKDAISMLRKQSGKSTKVLSSYTYISKDKEISRTVCSEVLFNPLSEAEIIEYIEKFQPFDKAGSYGIQDDYPLINKIEGSYYNVMGLPVEDLAEHVFKR